MTELLFVYGTLKYGHVNNWVLREAEFQGPAITARAEWDLVSLGPFPALVPGNSFVAGEIYRVDAMAQARVKMLEGSLYHKTLITMTPTGTWWHGPRALATMAYTWVWSGTPPYPNKTDVVLNDTYNIVTWMGK